MAYNPPFCGCKRGGCEMLFSVSIFFLMLLTSLGLAPNKREAVYYGGQVSLFWCLAASSMAYAQKAWMRLGCSHLFHWIQKQVDHHKRMNVLKNMGLMVLFSFV